MGTVIPGFIPTPLGEVFEYTPTAIELGVSVGIWAMCALVFTVLAKAGIALERGDFRAAGGRAAGLAPKQPTG
jgi:molybdopterin-containing oxidoreductase family membrane subunit